MFRNLFSRYYKITFYHNPEPSVYFKTGLFGRLKIIVSKCPSNLEKATEEEICIELDEEKKKYSERCSKK